MTSNFPIRKSSMALLLVVALATLHSTTAWFTPPTTAARTRSSSCASLHAVQTDAELLPIVREGLQDKGPEVLDEWNACAQFLAEEVYDNNLEAAEISLAAALEWRGWARVTSELARKYMKPTLPNLPQLQSALAWLREGPLQLTSNAQLQEALEQSPIAYLVDPEAAYQEALATAPKQYKDPAVFLELLQSDPSALQCNYNCADDGCNSECGTCWVTFDIKRKQSRKQVEF